MIWVMDLLVVTATRKSKRSNIHRLAASGMCFTDFHSNGLLPDARC